MIWQKGRRYWRNLGCFLIAVLALAAVGLVVGVSWMQADAFLHPHRHLLTETNVKRQVVGFFDAALLGQQPSCIEGECNGSAIH